MLTISCAQTLVYTDQSFEIDYQNNQNNHTCLFWTSDEISDDGNEIISVLYIQMPHLIDIRDHDRVELEIVNSGRALLLTRPTVSKVFEDEFHLYQAEEENPKESTQGSHDVSINRAREMGWRTTKILMTLPNQGICTADCTSDCKMRDGVVNKKIRLVDFETIQDGIPKEYSLQRVQPVNWCVRLAHVERKVLKIKSQAKSGLEEAFAGMKLPSKYY